MTAILSCLPDIQDDSKSFSDMDADFYSPVDEKNTRREKEFINGWNHSTFTSMTVASFVWVTVTPSRWTAILPSARPANGGSENVI